MACHEAERLRALRHLRRLDTAPTVGFDRIPRMVARIFGLPIAAVSLTDHDRHWFKSKIGMEHTTIPRLNAPCSEVAEEINVLVIPDFLSDPGYADSHFARSGVRFHAGAPLVTRDRHGLGPLYVLGTESRSVTPAIAAPMLKLGAMRERAGIRGLFGQHADPADPLLRGRAIAWAKAEPFDLDVGHADPVAVPCRRHEHSRA